MFFPPLVTFFWSCLGSLDINLWLGGSLLAYALLWVKLVYTKMFKNEIP